MASSNSRNMVYVVSAAHPTGSSDLALRNQLTALVADNSRVTRLIHRTYLNTLGVDCWEVESGLEAVELCEIGLIKFDLILMEHDLPTLDGPQTTRLLRRMGVDSVIVGVTGRYLGMEIQEFIDAGLDEYLEKPLNRAKLIPLLRQIDDDK
ncbi:Signal transduction response regulator [Macleaya cordata]|uniref:Signal transduction response regulator n=1 Tax=Macleaya cordata TaxID=56857 RepID=A0A200PVI8_MACCD|nr:Signal transduction response regulator [Macleaya cordata]